MRKILPSALLAASAVGALLVLPAGTASALSPACQTAGDIYNSYGSLGPSPQQRREVADRLRAIEASGDERTAIDNFANALDNGDVSLISTTGVLLNGICGRG